MTFARRRLRLIGIIGSTLVLLLLLLFGWAWHQVEQGLPPLDGSIPLPGLSQPATLTRDERGTVRIQAATQADAFRSLGFAHGQDRFFQMDTLRRRAAGEMAALVGPMAVDLDRAARVHRFRTLAGEVLAREPAPRRALIDSYVAGVNAGLASLPGRPWEYLALRSTPEPWTAVDTVLVLYAMTFDLQDSTGAYELALTALRDGLGEAAVNFFNPLIGPADSALDGTEAPLPPPPLKGALDLRRAGRELALTGTFAERQATGSNAFVVPGSRTTHGAALLAGDPHLELRIPNVWYRAQLEWTRSDGRAARVVGATLPGVPAIIIGSNGQLAWTFTNSYVDTGDLVALDLNQTAPEIFYHRGREMLEFEKRIDEIAVKGEAPVTVETVWTVWGPVVGQTQRGKQLAYKWTMHDVAAANLELFELMTAGNVEEGLAIAYRSGIPAQNIVLADAEGAAAWTIAGKLPKRFGFDGRFPVSWTYGDRGWEGYLSSAEIPVVRADAAQPLWSANQRAVGGEALRRLGDAGYYEPDRARQIEQGLAELLRPADRKVEPEDLLALQLDARGRWLDRWRTLLLATLDEAALEDQEARAELRTIVAADSTLAAVPDSAAYRLVRAWHDRLAALTLTPIFATTTQAYPEFNYGLLRTEEALWALHEQEPDHLLPTVYADWRALRLAAADQTLARLREQNLRLTEATWGERNRAAIRHPIGSALPFGIGEWFDLPAVPLPGDHHVPRVQRPAFGASLRLVVAPGHEEEGILHLPAGQSGNPLSTFYRAGHDAWVAGESVPLLAGEAQHTLTLTP